MRVPVDTVIACCNKKNIAAAGDTILYSHLRYQSEHTVILQLIMICGMPSLQDTQPHGNLKYYKLYIMPVACKMYGRDAKTTHQKNVHNLLLILFAHGACTTWDMAKTRQHTINAVREQEKIYRRLLIGRTDRNRHSGGMQDIGLTVKEKNTSPYARYRLSLHGILYCLDALNLTTKEIDGMAEKYAFLLPKVFGRQNILKSVLGTDAYNLRILSKGLFLNNIKMARTDNPLYEMMSYIHIKYRRNFESISEHDLSEQISYWFYTFLLYSSPEKLKKVLAKDQQLQKWYVSFFRETRQYYTDRLRTIKNSKIF